MSTPTGPTVMPKVRLLLERTAALADHAGDAEAATRLRTELARPSNPQTSVVVVGETKRGKSSLLNALLARPQLVPVDTDVATCVHLSISYAKAPGAWVKTLVDGKEITTEVPLVDVGAYASMAGNPGNAKRVRSVEIGVDHPLLAQRLTLVDTPGVGGLEAGHTAITLAQLAGADALIFVLDPSAPISDPEVEFLAAAATRISTVFFVLTKIDAFPQWRAIVEENRSIIANRVPALTQAPVLPVSNVLKAAADAEARVGNGAEAATLLAESGFEALTDTLVRVVVGRAESLRAANLCGIAAATLAELRRESEILLRSAEGDPTLAAELAAEQARYAAFAADAATWRNDLRDGFSLLTNEITMVAAEGLNDVEERAQAQLTKVGPDIYDRLPQEMSDLIEGYWVDLNTTLNRRATELVTDVVAQFELEGVRIRFDDIALPDRARDLGAVEVSEKEDKTTSEKISEGFFTIIPGMSATSIGTLVGASINPLALFAAGVAIFGGAKFLTGQNREEKLRREKDARTYVTATIRKARVLAIPVQRQCQVIRIGADKEIHARLQDRSDTLKANLTAHQSTLRAAQSERDKSRAIATRRLADITALEGQGADIRAALAAGVPASAPARRVPTAPRETQRGPQAAAVPVPAPAGMGAPSRGEPEETAVMLLDDA